MAMVSVGSFSSRSSVVDNHSINNLCSKLPIKAQPGSSNHVVVLPAPIFRRSLILLSVIPLTVISSPQQSVARDRRNKKIIPLEDYLTGLCRFFSVETNSIAAIWVLLGTMSFKIVKQLMDSNTMTLKWVREQKLKKDPLYWWVHFDCLFGKITAVSSRESKLLAGNRIIAQPYEFKVGAPPGKERKRDFVDNPNGLFSAQAAPRPPAAMYSISEGMRVGGKRSVIVPPEAGYGNKGMIEIPPGANFVLNIELLQVIPPETK